MVETAPRHNSYTSLLLNKPCSVCVGKHKEKLKLLSSSFCKFMDLVLGEKISSRPQSDRRKSNYSCVVHRGGCRFIFIPLKKQSEFSFPFS